MANEFEWDEAQRFANLRKHGLDFAEAANFDFRTAVVVPDRRHDYGEERFRAYLRIGGAGRALTFTWRGARMRIISLRAARERELRRYGL